MKKTRIEHRHLQEIGATKEQLDTYSNTDPLDIYEADGIYSVSGVIEAECLTAADLLDLLDCLSDDEKVWYFINDDVEPSSIYIDSPVCIDLAEINRLSEEWENPDLIDLFHVASKDEIEEYGIDN